MRVTYVPSGLCFHEGKSLQALCPFSLEDFLVIILEGDVKELIRAPALRRQLIKILCLQYATIVALKLLPFVQACLKLVADQEEV